MSWNGANMLKSPASVRRSALQNPTPPDTTKDDIVKEASQTSLTAQCDAF